MYVRLVMLGERLSEVDRGKADGWGHRANGEVGREVRAGVEPEGDGDYDVQACVHTQTSLLFEWL